MSTKTDQETYIELYFDLEKIKTKMAQIGDTVTDAMSDLTHIYTDENQLAAEGKKIPVRPPLDIASRAALSSSIAMLIPQLQQIQYSIAFAQHACEMMAPALQASTTPN